MRRWSAAVVVPVALLGLLSACTPEAEPAPSASAAPSVTAAPTETAPAPVALNPEGSAADNKAFFDQVNQALVAGNPAAGGVEFTSNLRTNGFDIAAMQVTPDITTVGVAADSIQFSVLWKNECLIGQYGHGAYTSTIAPVLGTGQCLIGQTRAIDW
ncbi:hypothetical protein HQQ85_17705 [Herbiconiux sp. VKM Ac-2851]|nr:hypothetical protein [Herbiconiux sp. VKM Ac-2851]